MMQDHTNQGEPVELTEHAKQDELTAQDLAQVTAGLVFSFKLVAVKTISWSYDDESPKEG